MAQNRGRLPAPRNLTVLLILFAVILVLHLIEIGVWAGAYFWQYCLPDFETSLRRQWLAA